MAEHGVETLRFVVLTIAVIVAALVTHGVPHASLNGMNQRVDGEARWGAATTVFLRDSDVGDASKSAERSVDPKVRVVVSIPVTGVVLNVD